MSTLVARLRAEVDEDVNELLDRLLASWLDASNTWSWRLSSYRRRTAHRATWPTPTCRRSVQTAAHLALRPQPTDDKINEAFKRATRC